MTLESFHEEWLQEHGAPFPYRAANTGMGDTYVSMDSSVDNITRAVAKHTTALKEASAASERLTIATNAQAAGLVKATWVLAWATMLLSLLAGLDVWLRTSTPT